MEEKAKDKHTLTIWNLVGGVILFCMIVNVIVAQILIHFNTELKFQQAQLESHKTQLDLHKKIIDDLLEMQQLDINAIVSRLTITISPKVEKQWGPEVLQKGWCLREPQFHSIYTIFNSNLCDFHSIVKNRPIRKARIESTCMLCYSNDGNIEVYSNNISNRVSYYGTGKKYENGDLLRYDTISHMFYVDDEPLVWEI